ncbi:Hypp6009 [Branchiostoma lanceolatum]|uniref:Hypp6009 protein n=1 Tax=Branchiostoma lanceolatum TaxID=7740 RepID=A0A8J9VJ80_BRALA|nr:Hypp6009 [Branchiostoma lanceolatum]
MELTELLGLVTCLSLTSLSSNGPQSIVVSGHRIFDVIHPERRDSPSSEFRVKRRPQYHSVESLVLHSCQSNCSGNTVINYIINYVIDNISYYGKRKQLIDQCQHAVSENNTLCNNNSEYYQQQQQ